MVFLIFFYFHSSKKESLLDDSSPSELKNRSDQIPEKDELLAKEKKIYHIPNADTDIQYIAGNLNSDDLYALPNKRKNCDGNNVYEVESDEEDMEANDEDGYDEEKGKAESIDGIIDKDRDNDLPFGWEKHEGTVINYSKYLWMLCHGWCEADGGGGEEEEI